MKDKRVEGSIHVRDNDVYDDGGVEMEVEVEEYRAFPYVSGVEEGG
jgi:hypothetical protein